MKKILEKKVDNLDFYKIFKPELSPQRMMELGVFGGAYFGLNVKEYPKTWFKNVKLSKTFDGFLKKIHWVGFNGTVDLLMEEEYLILMKLKLKDGKISEDMFQQLKKIVKKVI